MLMKKLFILNILNLFFVLHHSFCFSQSAKSDNERNRSIDSLLTVLKTAKEDTTKVNALNNLFLKYEYADDEKSKEYLNKAFELSQKIDFKNGLATTYSYLGYFEEDKGNYPEALKNYLTSLKIRKAIGDIIGEASCYNNIGIIYRYQSNYPEALKKHFAALKIYEKINFKSAIAASYNNIGIIYEYQGNYVEALINHFASLRIKEEIGDKQTIAKSYNNIGNIYTNQGNYPDALKNYIVALNLLEDIGDKKGIAAANNNIGIIYSKQSNYSEALKNHFASLKISLEIGDKQGIANSYENMGTIYSYKGNFPKALENHLASLKISEDIKDKRGVAASFSNIGDIYTNQSNYTEALKNQIASLKIREEIGDKHGIATSFSNIGYVFIKQKKFNEALESLMKAKKLSIEIGDKECMKNIYEELTLLDSAKGNFKGAYENHKMYMLYHDSIDNEETKKKTIQISMNYEFDKRETAIKAEQDIKDAVTVAERKKQLIITWSVALGLLLVLVFAGFIFRSLRITNRQKNIIEQQKNEVSEQKDIAEELREIAEKQKHIVEEKQKEIIQSITYAKRIQTALLTSDKYINDHLPAEHFILFKPKDIVSGDFYWALSIAPVPGWDMGTNKVKLLADAKRENTFYMVTADCTGHGVPGAFMSMLNISYLNENIIERGIRLPHDILNTQRKEIIHALNPIGSTDEAKDGMDCILCAFDFNKMLLHFAAANNPLWLMRKGELTEYKADKMPVGKYTEKMRPFTLQTIELLKGDIIYTSTDGYADQFGGPAGKKFKSKQLKELLLANSYKPMPEQKKILNSTIDQWKGKLEQVDDITIIGIRI